jgi:hypothetical protein
MDLRGKGQVDVGPPQELTFGDLLDVINPLQHLPVISHLYRAIAEDEIKPAMRILGDLAYGGPLGFVASCLTVLFEEISGDDVVDHAFAILTDDNDKPLQLASADGGIGVRRSSEAGAVYAAFTPGRGTNR